MKLRFVRIWLGEQRLDAVFEDDAGKRRMVRFKWKTKDRTEAPPPNWYSVVTQELRFMDSIKARTMAR